MGCVTESFVVSQSKSHWLIAPQSFYSLVGFTIRKSGKKKSLSNYGRTISARIWSLAGFQWIFQTFSCCTLLVHKIEKYLLGTQTGSTIKKLWGHGVFVGNGLYSSFPTSGALRDHLASWRTKVPEFKIQIENHETFAPQWKTPRLLTVYSRFPTDTVIRGSLENQAKFAILLPNPPNGHEPEANYCSPIR